MARIIYPHLSKHLVSKLGHDYTSKICSDPLIPIGQIKEKVLREELHLSGKYSEDEKGKIMALLPVECRQHSTITESLDWARLLPTETARIHLRFFQASVEGKMFCRE